MAFFGKSPKHFSDEYHHIQGMEARFPGIKVKIVVDYSKFHDARIDLQLANGALVPDVAILQTLQDFPRWKQEGVLMQYKPANWSKIYRKYRDKDGFYMGVSVVIFSYVVNSQLVPNKTDWPHLATDFLNPIFKGKKLVITYPNDDDAVLFMFKQVSGAKVWAKIMANGYRQEKIKGIFISPNFLADRQIRLELVREIA